MTSDLRTAAVLAAAVLICLALWGVAGGALFTVWQFLLFLIGAAA